MIIKITLFYSHAEPAMKMVKVPNNWLVIVEKSEKETSIKCGSEFPIITFKNRDVIKYEIEKILNDKE